MENLRKANIVVATLTGAVLGTIIGFLAAGPVSRFTSLFYFSTEFLFLFIRALLPVSIARMLDSYGPIILVYAGLTALVAFFLSLVMSFPLNRIRHKMSGQKSLIFNAGLLSGLVVFGYCLIWMRIALMLAPSYLDFSELATWFGVVTIAVFILVSGIAGVAVSFIVWVASAAILAMSEKKEHSWRYEAAALLAVWVVFIVGWSVFHSWSPAGYAAVAGTHPDKKGKVLIFGLDGADWSVMNPLLEQGKLPNIKTMIDNGASGQLRTNIPFLSPVIWTTMATGKDKRHHGVRGFFEKADKDGERVPITSASRKTKALWNILTENGMTSDFVGWYVTWPAEKTLGTMVTDRVRFPVLSDRVFPPERVSEIDGIREECNARVGQVPSLFGIESEAKIFDKMREDQIINEQFIHYVILKDCYLRDATMAESALRLIKTDKPDLAAVLLRASDEVGHHFWKYYAKNRNPLLAHLLYDYKDDDNPRFADVYPRIYEYADGLLGELWDAMGREDTTVILVSDHGFGPRREGQMRLELNILLYRLGLLSYKDDTVEIDWKHTKVFDVFSNRHTSRYSFKRYLKVNLEGREPSGSVKPGAEYDELCKKVAQTLSDLRTTTGKKAFVNVLFRNDLRTDGDTEFMVELDPRVIGEDLLIDGAPYAVKNFYLSLGVTGFHAMNGVIIASGPCVRRGVHIEGANVLDITPTVLYLLGLPVGKDMQGRVLEKMIQPSLLAARSVRWIPSYDTTGVKKGGAIPSNVDDEIRDHLRALGYLN